MIGRRWLLILLCGLSGLAIARGRPEREAPPAVIEPLPFDHARHAGELQRVGLRCVDCHAVGDPAPDALAADGQPRPSEVPRAVCHACHRDAVRGASPAAPGRCSLCHPNAADLVPESHGAHWIEQHVGPARSLRADCTDCHARRVCVECHEARGALTRSPHPTGFRGLHGVEARLDPGTCDRCHVADSCVQCHRDGGLPW